MGGAGLKRGETVLSDTSDTLGFETEKNSELGFEVEVVGQIEGRMGRGLAVLGVGLDLRGGAYGPLHWGCLNYSRRCLQFIIYFHRNHMTIVPTV